MAERPCTGKPAPTRRTVLLVLFRLRVNRVAPLCARRFPRSGRHQVGLVLRNQFSRGQFAIRIQDVASVPAPEPLCYRARRPCRPVVWPVNLSVCMLGRFWFAFLAPPLSDSRSLCEPVCPSVCLHAGHACLSVCDLFRYAQACFFPAEGRAGKGDGRCPRQDPGVRNVVAAIARGNADVFYTMMEQVHLRKSQFCV